MSMARKKSSSPSGGDKTVKARASKTVKKTKNVKLNVKRLAISFGAFVFCIYFICVMTSQQLTLSRKNNEVESLNVQINAANQETIRLKEELENVNDPEYLERMAREKLGLVAPNERVYIDINSVSQ